MLARLCATAASRFRCNTLPRAAATAAAAAWALSPYHAVAAAAAAAGGVPTPPTPAPVPLLVVQPRSQRDLPLIEAAKLAETLAGRSCPHVLLGARGAAPSPATFFGAGAVERLAQHVREARAERAFVNAVLSGVQARNLGAALGVPVVDRVGLIIDIFARRARTREAQLQVELARLEHQASMLVRARDAATGGRGGFGEGGAVQVVSARERGRSGGSAGGLGGAGGGGEKELQLQRRRLQDRRALLRKRIADVRRTRAVQRAGRRRSGLPVIALVGYTNAGKTTLLHALAGARMEEGPEDKLFATLDPTARLGRLPSGRAAIFVDTVGFISGLPVQLVDAFRATLEEVVHADVLLHVLDASSPHVLEQRAAVLSILADLGVGPERLASSVVEVWNKADLLRPGEPLPAARPRARPDAPTLREPLPAAQPADAVTHDAGHDDARRAEAAGAASTLVGAINALSGLEGDPGAPAARVVTSLTSDDAGVGRAQLLLEVERKLLTLRPGRGDARARQGDAVAAAGG